MTRIEKLPPNHRLSITALLGLTDAELERSLKRPGMLFNDTLWHGFQNGVLSNAASQSDDPDRDAQLVRRCRDDQEEYWRVYQILNRVVAQASPTALGKQAAERAIYCLRKIREDRFGQVQDISHADLRLSRWLERH